MATTREKNIAKRIAVLEKKLIVKNRELEIEAALERVRTVAMDMKNPDDLLLRGADCIFADAAPQISILNLKDQFGLAACTTGSITHHLIEI